MRESDISDDLVQNYCSKLVVLETMEVKCDMVPLLFHVRRSVAHAVALAKTACRAQTHELPQQCLTLEPLALSLLQLVTTRSLDARAPDVCSCASSSCTRNCASRSRNNASASPATLPHARIAACREALRRGWLPAHARLTAACASGCDLNAGTWRRTTSSRHRSAGDRLVVAVFIRTRFSFLSGPRAAPD